MKQEIRHWKTGLFVFVISVMLIYLIFFSLMENIGMTLSPITGLVVLSGIPDRSFEEDNSTTINLNLYLSDAVIENISWSYSELKNLIITINQDNIAEISAKANWHGKENVTFTAIDVNGSRDSDNITITVTPTNDPPEIGGFLPESLKPLVEETIEIDFEIDAYDVDGDNLTIKWYFDNSLEFSGDSWSYTPSSNQTGNHTVKAVVLDGELEVIHYWNITVIELNTPPILVEDIPNKEWEMNTNLTEVYDLDDYFDDPENRSMEYSFEGNENITIKINRSNNKPGFYPKKGWYGTETVRFIADDGSLIKKSNNIILTVTFVQQENLSQQDTQQQNCTELWNCTEWQPAQCPENKIQTRTCYDLNNCEATTKKPSESKICVYKDESTNKTPEDTETTTKKDETEGAKPSPAAANKFKTMLFIISIFIITGMLGFVGFERSRSKRKLDEEKKSKDIENTSLLRLTNYIRRELQQGFSEEKIKSQLLYEGWNGYIIEKAFSNLASLRIDINAGQKESGIESMVKKDIKEEIKEKMKAFEV